MFFVFSFSSFLFPFFLTVNNNRKIWREDIFSLFYLQGNTHQQILIISVGCIYLLLRLRQIVIKLEKRFFLFSFSFLFFSFLFFLFFLFFSFLFFSSPFFLYSINNPPSKTTGLEEKKNNTLNNPRTCSPSQLHPLKLFLLSLFFLSFF